jgi:hypothetical protein
MLQVLPPLAYAGALAAILMAATGRGVAPALRWGIPAGLGILFTLFSLWTVAEEGLVQFWINHTTTMAGVQVWFDLVLAVTIAFVLIAPRARAVGMPLLPWGIAVIATACIALLFMLARLLWLEARATPRP